MFHNKHMSDPQAWWDSAGFGVMIHWGVYSITGFHVHPKRAPKIDNGSEWYLRRLTQPARYGPETKEYHDATYPNTSYYDLASQLNDMLKPDKKDAWNASSLADLCYTAGARYVVITAKHHDGFCMWPTQYPSMKLASGKKWYLERDVLMELKTAVESKGIKFGIYYSLYEWCNPLYRRPEYVTSVVLPQQMELVARYKPEVWWSDGDWEQSPEYWHSKLFIDWYHKMVPSGVTNDRWGKGGHVGDYRTYTDRSTSGSGRWEGVHPIGQGWGYNIRQPQYKSPSDIYRLFMEIRRTHGNLLLSIGPRGDGSITEEETNVLKTWRFTSK